MTATSHHKNNKNQICTRGVFDSSIPGIAFDEDGVANYCQIHDMLVQDYPRGEQGKKTWELLVEKMKKDGKSKAYDCIIGVSGGTDSSYLLHMAKEYGLNPLAVNLDNGWNSDISVRNIKKLITKLNVDLETLVIDYEEIKDILKSYIRAGLPWIDVPTDIAIQAAVYKIAAGEGIKHILIGSDFRSEGKQPTEWTYSDAKQLKYLLNRFGTQKIRSFPYLTLFRLIYYGYFKGIKLIYPYLYIDYQKKAARELLKEQYNWEDYGGHHHENTFTKFAISYWLPKKFNVDKRKITLSAQVLSGEITRDEALRNLKEPPYDTQLMERDKDYVLKKLDLSEVEFAKIWNEANRAYFDYPSYYPMIKRFLKIVIPFLSFIIPWKPAMFYEMEVRGQNNGK